MEHGENQKEANMKTPHEILIGLSLIAAAIFSKDTGVKPAHAIGGQAQKVSICDINGKVCANIRDEQLLSTLISIQ